MKRLLAVAGMISLLLGVAGLFIPLLPTTPFLLLAASLFLRSSQKLYRWLTAHRHLGRYIYYYQHFRAVSRKTQTASILLLWVSIVVSAFLIDLIWVKVILVLVAAGVTLHLRSFSNLTEEMEEEYERYLNDLKNTQ